MNQPATRKNRPWIMIAVVVGILLLLGYGVNAMMKMVTQRVSESMVENMMEKAAGDKADVKVRDGTMQVKTDEGTFATGQTMPKDWPADAPVYPKSEVQYSASMNKNNGSTGYALVLMSTDDVDTVASYYADELKKQGWTISANSQIASSTMIAATKDTRTMSAMIAGGDGRTTITLGVGQDE
ncbi:MAG TPA: hypothetical protein PKV72_05885 [Candidatus Peribacteria bacterium]|nr:hypothetical protein [Candidatus Peribacteria bacterium]